MEVVPVLVIVFGTLILIIEQLRRLFVAVSLNRSIRDAMRHHPDSVPALIAQLEKPSQIGVGIIGWVFLGLAVIMGVMVAFAADGPDHEGTVAAIVVAGMGIAMHFAAWLVSRRSAANQAATSSMNSG